MTTAIHPAAPTLPPEILQSLIIGGDLYRLTPQQRVEFYLYRCRLLDLDPAEKPFDLIFLNGKLVLYATKACTDALCRSRGLKRAVTSRELMGEVYVVTARAEDSAGRYDESTGVVPLVYPETVKDREGNVRPHPKAGQPMTADDRSNAMMKAETKSKRRAVLSLCGLGMLDESETEMIPDARKVALDAEVAPPAVAGTGSSSEPARPKLRLAPSPEPPPPEEKKETEVERMQLERVEKERREVVDGIREAEAALDLKALGDLVPKIERFGLKNDPAIRNQFGAASHRIKASQGAPS